MDRKKSRLESQLCEAVNDGDPRAVQLLLSQGARPDLVASEGVAAIHLAAGKETEKNTRCLKMFLQHGADPNVRASDGLTPLHIAALWGCYQNLKLLLINGGNPNIKHDEGHTPGQLAKQQENRRCAQLLQEYQLSSVETEEDELPQFQYSVYSDQTDTSVYPETDYSFSSRSSVISDFGEAPLSSTRRSSFFNLSNINGRPDCRGLSYNTLSDMDAKRHRSQLWTNPASHCASECPSILSSTRVSAVGPAAAMPTCKEEVFFDDGPSGLKANKQGATTEDRSSASRRDTLPVFSCRQASRKSVSFRNDDEYFPVFSPESPEPCTTGLAFDMSEYSDFLDSERMATVLHKQGLDVTSPDHVYVFCRESGDGTVEDMEKTVVGHGALAESDGEAEGQYFSEPQVDIPEQPLLSPASAASSGSGSSHYSSCESEHYISTLDASLRPGQLPLPAVHGAPVAAELEPCGSPVLDASSDAAAAAPPRDEAAEISPLPFMTSPFVTGRTRSRLSRFSMRTGRPSESLLSTSSLFEVNLPAPVRTRRHTPRSQSREDFYSSPHAPCCTPSYSGRGTVGAAHAADCRDSPSSTLTAGPSVSSSQADTLILSRSVTDSTLCDTVLLEGSEDSSMDAYERNLAEVVQAMQGHKLAGSQDCLTDDRTSTSEATTRDPLNAAAGKDNPEGLKKEDVLLTEDYDSPLDSVSSSSSSSSSTYFSPRRSREDSDLPCTPGTGCTPRYSMSRLSCGVRPQHLASLSYTPGGRPLIQDLDEAVEYLYTDSEQGHELIETHVPPTANTSLSSSMSASSTEDTVLYDWRADLARAGKENRPPQTAPAKKGGGEDRVPPDTSGMTDQELRSRLLALGESPGPIGSRTRPVYMRRLRRLLQESSAQSPRPQRPSDQPHTDLGYSPELCRALRTFELPDCQADEQALCQQFDQPDQNRKWREGLIKSSFNYLLLDPRVTKNLPFRSQTMTLQECFQTFTNAIFYVGKGKRSRPYSHLYEALEYFKGDKTSKKLCPKVQHILQVWKAEQGVVSLHCFQNVIPVEAYTREACMVEAIGLKMLTNQKRGDFYGVVSTWQVKKKRDLGVHLLYRAMQIFLAEGERQLRPADIRQ
ncbi:ankyrin repeat and LEM domain-containing protein 1 [Pungitius pungitius]|uniref:ankyrin repeat and LEM domain-containing protein 1 n=1 Tax=Pungitius pungitius TaxID=134920 RepID=UPI002E154D05